MRWVQVAGVNYVPKVEKNQKSVEPCATANVYPRNVRVQEDFMRGVLLWLVGIPIPIIIMLYLFHAI